ncbi:MAG: hypothetical protein E7536_05145, partial [Ruminococcaceae bacterium]|nr:hypothetical protein [Oscillospiraceae bacterium]
MKKKILAVALSVIMLFSVIPFTAMAADEASAGTDFVFDFEFDKTEVKAGEVIDVTLNVTGAEGAQTVGWQFELVLPEGLEYVDNSAVMNAETKALYNAGEFSFENSTKVMVCVEANGEALRNTTGTNEIMTFQLKVADDAAAGDELTFELLDFLVMNSEAGELDMDKVELNIDTATVVVDPDFTFDFTASKTNVVAGEEVEITVSVTAVEDAETVGWQFELVLPEGLEYVDNSAVMNAETKALYNAGEFSFENSTKVMVCVEANGEALANIAGTNEIMTFKLKVADDAVAGDEYTFELLDFLVMDGDAKELDMSLVKLNIDTLTIVDHVCSADKLTYVEATDADCVNEGNVAYYVCECGLKYGDADAKQPAGDTIVPALGHTEGEAVKENEVAADCENAGSYEEVVYCEVCGEELSRTEVPVEALGHEYEAVVTEP